MAFWGFELKNGESLKVTPGEDMILHLTQACLGIKQGKESEPVCLFVKVGDQKLGIGILSSEKLPQISLNLVFEKDFELSHSWKHGSVFFTGYRARSLVDEEVTDSSDYEDDDIPIRAANGEPESKVMEAVRLVAVEAGLTGKMRGRRKDGNGQDEEDSSEFDESDEDSGKDEPTENGGEAGSEDGDDIDEGDNESEDKETPEKPEAGIKRPAKSSKKTPVPEKMAKLVTPHKTDGKKGGHVHIATPYPSKQAGKVVPTNAAQAKETHESTAEYSCKPCNRLFKTENGLQSHNRAKHSA
ncbi:histone deacetylase HDT1-like isoform X2 [Prosopis cineraria]|uniref:histone deacetylase HDT1-like isoform X2 n=1 Tax=Prosopis cineraria TaxID=364024 RepID=UPI00240F6DFA|nr:histone deacetylase HDT1-like isoform X2 [Prosopis cineraria]